MGDLTELTTSEELSTYLSTNKYSVICFSATWCGPCKASKPELESIASSYTSDPTHDIKFGIVLEDNLKEELQKYNIRAFPTYVLYRSTEEVDRVEGVNFDGVKAMISKEGCKKDLGEGQTLGSGAVLSKEDARLARLAAFEKSVPTPMEEEVKEEVEVAAVDADGDVTMSPAPEETKEEIEEIDDPISKLDPESITQLTETMGFTLLRSQKALFNSSGTVESAVEWLLAHQDDADIDDPIVIPPPSTETAQSYKCNQCGAVLSSIANLELHANKTGHADFEESTEHIKPLTAEERAAKMDQIKELLKKKRRQREQTEKEDNVIREKARRTTGQEMTKVREQMDMEKRKRSTYLRKKEKDNVKRERERIRAELAKDKAERIANKGKLGSRLGVDGYHPDGIQYDQPGDTAESSSPKQDKPKRKVDPKKIDDYIQKVSMYRAGGDGGKCLKILLAYVKNVADSDDDKFKTIKTDNKTFKTKVKPFIGGKQLLMAVGFKADKEGEKMVLSSETQDKQLLKDTKEKLEVALAKYG